MKSCCVELSILSDVEMEMCIYQLCVYFSRFSVACVYIVLYEFHYSLIQKRELNVATISLSSVCLIMLFTLRRGEFC